MTSSTNASSGSGSSTTVSTSSSGAVAAAAAAAAPGVTSASVGEIFQEAGSAFQQLGELTRSLHIKNEAASTSSKWTETELAFFRSSIRRFSSDLLTLTTHMRKKTRQQMKISLKRKAYEEAGVPSDKAPGFASQTVKDNPAERLSPLIYEDEEMKTEPTTTDLPSPTPASPTHTSPTTTTTPTSSAMSIKRSRGEEMTLNSLNAEPDKDDTLEDGELRDEDAQDEVKDNDGFSLSEHIR